ncbi:MAG: hypothetical protein ACFB21_03345 [Opitutales bacterium]
MADKPQRAILGLGLDNDDGHKRITQAERFAVVGGSEETHERMTETLMKTMEDLRRGGRSLDDVEAPALADLIRKNTPE